MSPWQNEGIDDLLKELVATAGVSFEDAAHKINQKFGTSLSRMACIGRARRKGFDVPESKQKFRGVRTRNAKTRRRKGRGDNGGGIMRTLLSKDHKKPEPYKAIIDTDIPLAQRKSILELTGETCKWPVGEPGTAAFFFCGGEAVEGKPYCGSHMARAYKALRGRPNLFIKRKRAA